LCVMFLYHTAVDVHLSELHAQFLLQRAKM
jgi:hypothetical protein